MMLKKLSIVLPVIFILIWSCESKREEKLKIACAANVQFAMNEICEAFQEESGVATDIIIGSSGKLTAQIEQGAPFDVFVSADMIYPQELYSSGYAANKPEIYAYGQLVLWTLNEELEAQLPVLFNENVKHIAMANPKTAPYGRAAMQALETMENYTQIKDKFVYGESVSQTNQFIMSGTAELGFTAISAVLTPQLKGQGDWLLLDQELYSPIAQGAVVIKKDEKDLRAEEFYNFLFSEKAKTIFGKYQYIIPEE